LSSNPRTAKKESRLAWHQWFTPVILADQENHSSKLARANNSRDTVKKTHHKKELSGSSGRACLAIVRPRVQTPVWGLGVCGGYIKGQVRAQHLRDMKAGCHKVNLGYKARSCQRKKEKNNERKRGSRCVIKTSTC
jgi:hypothetical protein